MDAIEKRRSYYKLNKKIDINYEELVSMLRNCLYYSPNPYNVQASRILLLTGKSHEQFWDTVVKEYFRKNNDGNLSEWDEARIKREKKAYGSILFFIDEKNMKDSMPKKVYEENYIRWTNDALAMLEINVWQSLIKENIGAHLEHFTRLRDEVKLVYKLPDSWSFNALLVFGGIEGEAPIKAKDPLDERLIKLD